MTEKWQDCNYPADSNPKNTHRSILKSKEIAASFLTDPQMLYKSTTYLYSWLKLATVTCFSLSCSPHNSNRSVLPLFGLSSPSHWKFGAPGGPLATIMGSRCSTFYIFWVETQREDGLDQMVQGELLAKWKLLIVFIVSRVGNRNFCQRTCRSFQCFFAVIVQTWLYLALFHTHTLLSLHSWPWGWKN